jgi:hypothetical protein
MDYTLRYAHTETHRHRHTHLQVLESLGMRKREWIMPGGKGCRDETSQGLESRFECSGLGFRV